MRWNQDRPRSTSLRSGARPVAAAMRSDQRAACFSSCSARRIRMSLRFGIALAVGEMPVGRWPLRPRAATSSRRSRGSPCRCAIYPISRSNSTIVPMPAAISSTWRSGVARRSRRGADRESGPTSRCRAGWPTRTRARTAGCPGTTCTAAKATSAPSDARRAGDDVQHQRPAAAVAGGEQDRDVADFLRDLVRGDGDRGVDAERHRRHHGGADDRAVDEVVERVADEDAAAPSRRAPGTRRCGSGAAARASRG